MSGLCGSMPAMRCSSVMASSACPDRTSTLHLAHRTFNAVGRLARDRVVGLKRSFRLPRRGQHIPPELMERQGLGVVLKSLVQNVEREV
jgi:hypothetical protein